MFFLLPVVTGCNWSKSTVQGDYSLVEEKIEISDYSEIVLNLPAEVVYQHYSDSLPYLQINTDQNILSHLNIRVEDHRLIVEAKRDTIIKPTKLVIYTTSTALRRVDMNGSGNLRLAGEVNARDLSLYLNGSGEITTDSLLCNNLLVGLNGSGKVTLTGAAGESTLTVNGSGKIDASNYFSEKIDKQVNGSGKIL